MIEERVIMDLGDFGASQLLIEERGSKQWLIKKSGLLILLLPRVSTLL